MPTATPPYIPFFGSGAPSFAARQGSVYFDISVNPFGFYTYVSGAWHEADSTGSGTDATSLAGTAIADGTPTTNQFLALVSSIWTPKSITAGLPLLGKVEAVVVSSTGQTITISDDTNIFLFTNTTPFAFLTLVMPANPTEGQIIILMSQQQFSTATYSANAGQTLTWGGTSPTNIIVGLFYIFIYDTGIWYARHSAF